jgi:gliding motility-associated-like protein
MKSVLFLFVFGFVSVNSFGQCWEALESGSNHTVAIHQDGTLWAWGANYNGEVGNGTTYNSNIPVLISTETNWISIAAGHSHNLALKSDGTLWSWGYGDYSGIGLVGITQIKVPTQVGIATDWKYISAGHSTSFAIKSDGSLWGWGLNPYGEIGDGTTTPKLVPTRVGTANNWAKVFTSENFTAAIKTDGTLWTWGSFNHSGELGTGNYTSSFIPIQVGTDTNWSSVAVGHSFGIGLKTNGTIWGWGSGSSGQFGNGATIYQPSPIQIGVGTDWKKIETGNGNSFFIKNDGTLWSSGYNFGGILGNGTLLSTTILTQVGSDADWISVSSQLFQTIALKNNHVGWGFGSNYFGQLGIGVYDHTTSYLSPIQINCPCTNMNNPRFAINQTVCLGGSVPVLPTISSNNISGTWSPSIVSNTVNATYIFTPNATLFPCAQSVSLPISITAVETPIFGIIPLSICQYSSALLLPNTTTNTTPLTGVWNPSSINTSLIGKTTYTFVPNTGQCVSSIPYQITIDVEPSVSSDFIPIGEICKGSVAPILSNVAPNGVPGTWSPLLVDNILGGDYVFTPTVAGCSTKQTLHVDILAQTIPDFSNLSLCRDNTSIVLESISPNGISGFWSPSVIDYTIDRNYLFTPDPFQCSSNQTISVSMKTTLLQSYDYEVTEAFSESPTITVITSPIGNYLYQLDDGVFQSSSIFKNVNSGLHSIGILDYEGCNNVVTLKDVRVINYPNYFTPNGDGFHDLWNIDGLNLSAKATIYIFDRFGKLLKQISSTGVGWDGSYNGHEMPSTDYWFRVDYFENNVLKQFSSHFALRR